MEEDFQEIHWESEILVRSRDVITQFNEVKAVTSDPDLILLDEGKNPNDYNTASLLYNCINCCVGGDEVTNDIINKDNDENK